MAGSLEELAHETLAAFQSDLRDLFRVLPLNNDVVGAAVSVAEEYLLRAGDAIHLASALQLSRFESSPQLVLVSADRELLEGARVAGLATLDPAGTFAGEQLRRFRQSA